MTSSRWDHEKGKRECGGKGEITWRGRERMWQSEWEKSWHDVEGARERVAEGESCQCLGGVWGGCSPWGKYLAGEDSNAG